VNDVLDFSKPIRFECSPTDINAVCENAVKAVAINGHTPPALHATAALPPLMTDRERLRMVLVNLLTNAQQAVEALHPGAASPLPQQQLPIVVTTAPLSGERVVISVRDRGPGIAPDDLPRVFDPYFTTRRGGTGLGLAISKNIVEGLGGTLSVLSRPGHGTEFRIELGHGPADRTH